MLNIDELLPQTAGPIEVLAAALSAVGRGQRVVVASVVARHGSAPSTPGQKLCLTESGMAVGTVGGGAVERIVLRTMVELLASENPQPRTETFRLGPTLGMCCGGAVDVLIEPLLPRMSVVVVGAGHVGISLAPILAGLGFRVSLCDSREEAARAERLSSWPLSDDRTSPIRVLHAEHDDPHVLEGVVPGASAALAMTHDHQLDQSVIEWALRAGFAYVGGVGSRAKAVRTRERLRAKGGSDADIERIRMPVGLAIAARTPQEIAIAIASELIAFRAAFATTRSEAKADAL